jgi:hypothetical protein
MKKEEELGGKLFFYTTFYKIGTAKLHLCNVEEETLRVIKFASVPELLASFLHLEECRRSGRGNGSQIRGSRYLLG